MERLLEVEKSIIKKYRRTIWKRFVNGVSDYDLIQPGDKIAVCISGGKDSMLLAKCMQELKRHWLVPFELDFIVMDPGYRPENLAQIEKNAALLGIPIHIFPAPIFNYVVTIEKSPCYLCARMRRGYLYREAQKRGCNKIALGHHFDDVIETILMSILYGAQMRTMMPKLHSTNFPGMELIRPLYLVKEADILAWSGYNHLTFLSCACRFTEQVATQEYENASKRKEIKNLIASLRKGYPEIDINIFRSAQNVNLDTLISYKKSGVVHHFLDAYYRQSDR